MMQTGGSVSSRSPKRGKGTPKRKLFSLPSLAKKRNAALDAVEVRAARPHTPPHKKVPKSPQHADVQSAVGTPSSSQNKQISQTTLDTVGTEDVSPSKRSNIAVPVEVEIVSDCQPQPTSVSFDDETSGGRIEVVQAEANEYLVQLQNTQSLFDQLTSDLNRSRAQVQGLLHDNKRLLKDLETLSSKEEGDDNEAYDMVVQELNLLKACLFGGILFVCCGGRGDFLATVALVWMVVDFVALGRKGMIS